MTQEEVKAQIVRDLSADQSYFPGYMTHADINTYFANRDMRVAMYNPEMQQYYNASVHDVEAALANGYKVIDHPFNTVRKYDESQLVAVPEGSGIPAAYYNYRLEDRAFNVGV
jgi:hypothetical protein